MRADLEEYIVDESCYPYHDVTKVRLMLCCSIKQGAEVPGDFAGRQECSVGSVLHAPVARDTARTERHFGPLDRPKF